MKTILFIKIIKIVNYFVCINLTIRITEIQTKGKHDLKNN